jgi:hypothetical protein
MEHANEVSRYNHARRISLSPDTGLVSKGFLRGRVRAVAAFILTGWMIAGANDRLLYAEAASPFAASIARVAVATARASHASADEASSGQPRASLAEKTAWAYLLVGGCIFIVTSPGEKNADGSWSRDGKAEMAAGIGAVGISFALLRDILKR